MGGRGLYSREANIAGGACAKRVAGLKSHAPTSSVEKNNLEMELQ